MLQKNTVKQPAFLVAGVLFTLIALVALAALLVLKSKGDTAEQQVNTGNTAPSLDSLIVSELSGSGDIGPAGSGTGFTTNEGSTKTLYVRGQLTDLNGCNDLQDLKITVYRSGATGADACTPDMNDCYSATLVPASFQGCIAGSNTVTFETSFSMANFVDPSDTGSPYDAQTWLAKGVVKDNSDVTNDLTSDFDVNSLAAFSVPDAINYGAVGLGQDSNAIGLTFSNTGNRAVDAEVIALVDPVHQPEPLVGDMTSNLTGFADIAASAVHYSLTSGFTYGTDDTAVSKTASTELALGLNQQTDDNTVPSVDSFWKLRVPSSGVNGTYTNVLVFTAVAGAGGPGMTVLPQVGEISFGTDSWPNDVVVSGDYAYVSINGLSSIGTVDISNPASPVQVATTTVDIYPSRIVKSGSNLFAIANNKLETISVSNPASPVSTATFTLPYTPVDMAISGQYAYLTYGAGDWMDVVDITNPNSASIVGTLTFTAGAGPGSVAVSGQYAYVVNNANDTFVKIDVSNPASPAQVASITLPGFEGSLTGDITSVAIYGDYAYVTNQGKSVVEIVDITNPTALSLAAETPLIGNQNIVTVSGPRLFTSDGVLDISNRTSPTQLASIQYNSAIQLRNTFVSGQYAYVTDPGNLTLDVIDISGLPAM